MPGNRDPLLALPAQAQAYAQMPPLVDLLPDIRNVIRSVQKIQNSNRAAFTMLEVGQGLEEFVWSQGAGNVKLFVKVFIEKLSGNNMQKFWHKQRLISTLQAVEHMYADVISMKKPEEVFRAFEYSRAWLFSADQKECPVEVSTVAKLLNCFAWMMIISFPTNSSAIKSEPLSYCWAELLSHPPEPTMKCLRVVQWGDGKEELRKKGIDLEKVDPPTVLFDPIDVSPEWFSLEYPVDVYCRWWFKRADHREWITQRIMGEFKFFLTMVIARLKNDVDIVSTLQTKIMGSMATLAFAGITQVMHQVQGDANMD